MPCGLSHIIRIYVRTSRKSTWYFAWPFFVRENDMQSYQAAATKPSSSSSSSSSTQILCIRWTGLLSITLPHTVETPT